MSIEERNNKAFRESYDEKYLDPFDYAMVEIHGEKYFQDSKFRDACEKKFEDWLDSELMKVEDKLIKLENDYPNIIWYYQELDTHLRGIHWQQFGSCSCNDLPISIIRTFISHLKKE